MQSETSQQSLSRSLLLCSTSPWILSFFYSPPSTFDRSLFPMCPSKAEQQGIQKLMILWCMGGGRSSDSFLTLSLTSLVYFVTVLHVCLLVQIQNYTCYFSVEQMCDCHCQSTLVNTKASPFLLLLVSLLKAALAVTLLSPFKPTFLSHSDSKKLCTQTLNEFLIFKQSHIDGALCIWMPYRDCQKTRPRTVLNSSPSQFCSC